jgi:hypothetical protein
MKVIPLGVVIRQVDISVPEQAVSAEEVVGLISREGNPLKDQDECAEIIEKKGNEEEKNNPFFGA